MTKPTRRPLKELAELAKQAAQNSYSPYSKFKVGAALRLNNGKLVTGTNVENASLGLTICAERAALVRAAGQFESEFGAVPRIRGSLHYGPIIIGEIGEELIGSETAARGRRRSGVLRDGFGLWRRDRSLGRLLIVGRNERLGV